MSLLNILASDNYFIYNKLIAKNLSIECAILLGYFSNQYSYYQKNNLLKEINGNLYFYSTRETIYEQTALTEALSRKATKLLIDKKILYVEKIGIPAKNYYYIDEKELEKYLKSIENLSSRSGRQLVLANDDNKLSLKESQIIINKNNNKNKDISNINITNIESQESSKKSPFNNEFIDTNKSTKFLNENIKCIIDYLNESINSKYTYKGKDTINNIKARFKDGYELDDFYNVIDNMVKAWYNTEMQIYLRPSTLFGNKFENYLNYKVFNGNIKSSYGSRPNFDNTKEHNVPKGIASMTIEERKKFEENELAKDENGNFLKF